MKSTVKTTQWLKKVARFPMLLLVLGVAGTVSCSEDDDRIEDPIVGTWQMRSFLAETTMTVEGMSGTMTLAGRDFEGVTITFNADGTSNSTGTYTLDITTTVAGVSNTTTVTANPTLANGGTWERRGNTLTTHHPSSIGPQNIEIDILDDTQLRLADAIPSPVPVPGMGNIIAAIWFTRVR